jgi:hypothetical protein
MFSPVSKNGIGSRHLIARECSVDPSHIETYLENNYAEKLLPRLNDKLIETLAVMKSFLYERRFIESAFELAEWIGPQPLAAAYRLEGLR